MIWFLLLLYLRSPGDAHFGHHVMMDIRLPSSCTSYLPFHSPRTLVFISARLLRTLPCTRQYMGESTIVDTPYSLPRSLSAESSLSTVSVVTGVYESTALQGLPPRGAY